MIPTGPGVQSTYSPENPRNRKGNIHKKKPQGQGSIVERGRVEKVVIIKEK